MDYVIKNPAMSSDKEESYELLEAALMEYLGLLDSQSKRPSGNINAASNRAEPQAVTTEFEYSEPWWDDYHGKWMCSVSELNDAAKRQRPDDGEDEMHTKEPEEEQQKGQSKSKGKGKSSGPRTKPVAANQDISQGHPTKGKRQRQELDTRKPTDPIQSRFHSQATEQLEARLPQRERQGQTRERKRRHGNGG